MSTETPWPTPLPSPQHDENPPHSVHLLWRALRSDAIALAVVGAASVAAGFPVGALWRWSAPAVLGVVNQGLVYPAAPESETAVARDGWFVLYACVAAVLLALFAFLRYRREAGMGAALGLVAGGIAGGYLAAWFGHVIGPGHGSLVRAAQAAANGTSFELPLSVRAVGAVWLWPAVAAGLFFFLMLLFGPAQPELEHEPFPTWGEFHPETDTSRAARNGFGEPSDGRTDPPHPPAASAP